jgi:hypothetical protein
MTTRHNAKNIPVPLRGPEHRELLSPLLYLLSAANRAASPNFAKFLESGWSTFLAVAAEIGPEAALCHRQRAFLKKSSLDRSECDDAADRMISNLATTAVCISLHIADPSTPLTEAPTSLGPEVSVSLADLRALVQEFISRDAEKNALSRFVEQLWSDPATSRAGAESRLRALSSALQSAAAQTGAVSGTVKAGRWDNVPVYLSPGFWAMFLDVCVAVAARLANQFAKPQKDLPTLLKEALLCPYQAAAISNYVEYLRMPVRGLESGVGPSGSHIRTAGARNPYRFQGPDQDSARWRDAPYLECARVMAERLPEAVNEVMDEVYLAVKPVRDLNFPLSPFTYGRGSTAAVRATCPVFAPLSGRYQNVPWAFRLITLASLAYHTHASLARAHATHPHLVAATEALHSIVIAPLGTCVGDDFFASLRETLTEEEKLKRRMTDENLGIAMLQLAGWLDSDGEDRRIIFRQGPRLQPTEEMKVPNAPLLDSVAGANLVLISSLARLSSQDVLLWLYLSMQWQDCDDAAWESANIDIQVLYYDAIAAAEEARSPGAPPLRHEDGCPDDFVEGNVMVQSSGAVGDLVAAVAGGYRSRLLQLVGADVVGPNAQVSSPGYIEIASARVKVPAASRGPSKALVDYSALDGAVSTLVKNLVLTVGAADHPELPWVRDAFCVDGTLFGNLDPEAEGSDEVPRFASGRIPTHP